MACRRVVLLMGLLAALAAGRTAAQAGINDWYTIALAASRNATDQVQELLADKFNDPDILDGQSGRTALDFAASFDNMAMAQLLLDHGAHVDWRDRMGNSALHFAAERGNLDMIRFLIARGATLDFANKQGITPVMVAAEHSQPGAARLLVQSGADPKKQDFTGRDAFGWAAGNPGVVQALKSKR
jgi:ankyrin repeat protein